MTTKVDAELDIPTRYKLDLGLDDVSLDTDVNANLGANLNATVGGRMGLSTESTLNTESSLDARTEVTAAIKHLAPLLLQLFWKEVPLIKVHSPHRYKLGFQIFGFELGAVTFEGDSELATSDNGGA